MPEVVPIYQHASKKGPDRCAYDQTLAAPSASYGEGVPVFYGYNLEWKKVPHKDPVPAPGGTPLSVDGPRKTYATDDSAPARIGFQEQHPPGDGSNQPWAYVDEDELGTSPVYAHAAAHPKPNEDRFSYTLAPSDAGAGWATGNAAFHAYPPPAPGGTPKSGTVGIYRLSSSGPPDRFQLTEHPETRGAGWNAQAAPSFYALPTGYRVGDRARDISGLDRSNSPVKLSDLQDRSSWIWVQICASWCGPCNWMARKENEFTKNITDQGVKLKTFSVLAQGREGPSTQQDAQQWAVKYDISPVVHSGGASRSLLSELAHRVAYTNGESQAGFPTSVLTDPSGVIKAYQVGMDFDLWQKTIGSYANVKLTGGPWNF